MWGSGREAVLQELLLLLSQSLPVSSPGSQGQLPGHSPHSWAGSILTSLQGNFSNHSVNRGKS